MSLPLTPTLDAVRNDTGRLAFCGPTVVSAITGFSVSRIEAAIHVHRGKAADADRVIRGTTAEEVAAALGVFGYAMTRVADFSVRDKTERPRFGDWLMKPRSAFTPFLLGIRKGREGHWITVKGGKICDTYTGGAWVFAAGGPHRGARVEEVYKVVTAA